MRTIAGSLRVITSSNMLSAVLPVWLNIALCLFITVVLDHNLRHKEFAWSI